MQNFSWPSLFIRIGFAFVLVFISFNPTGYSYFHWLKSVFPSLTPYVAIAGIGLIIGWAMFIRATLRSLGPVGIVLALLLQACLVWLFIDLGWLDWKNMNAMAWLALMIISVLLGVGMSWSHIRRRVSGQVDTDDVDDK
jgi:predicted ABC-type exoprotein transport system permease subunit